MDGKLLLIIYNIGLIAVCGTLAFFVTPWALLGLVFLANSDTRITVKKDGGRIDVRLSSAHDIDEDKVRAAVEEAFRNL